MRPSLWWTLREHYEHSAVPPHPRATFVRLYLFTHCLVHWMIGVASLQSPLISSKKAYAQLFFHILQSYSPRPQNQTFVEFPFNRYD